MAKSLVEIIREGLAPGPDDEDEGERIELMAPLAAAEIDALERELPCPLPADVRGLLGFCGGIKGGAAEVDFARLRGSFEMASVFPHGHPIGADGRGSFWVVDLFPSSKRWGPIYFAGHDPAVILLQSPSMPHFLAHVLKREAPMRPRLIDEVHGDDLFDVWRTNPGVLSHAACLASPDEALRGFATELGASFEIIDMRNGEIGFGFSWRRYGAETVVRRAGRLAIFAYEKGAPGGVGRDGGAVRRPVG